MRKKPRVEKVHGAKEIRIQLSRWNEGSKGLPPLCSGYFRKSYPYEEGDMPKKGGKYQGGGIFHDRVGGGKRTGRKAAEVYRKMGKRKHTIPLKKEGSGPGGDNGGMNILLQFRVGLVRGS